VLPDGSRHDLPGYVHEQASAQIRDAVRGWQTAFSLSPEQAAALLLDAIYSNAVTQETPSAGGDNQPLVTSEAPS
jgi:hypothetical protein